MTVLFLWVFFTPVAYEFYYFLTIFDCGTTKNENKFLYLEKVYTPHIYFKHFQYVSRHLQSLYSKFWYHTKSTMKIYFLNHAHANATAMEKL